MNWKYSKPCGGVAIAIALALAGALTVTSSRTAIAQSGASASGLRGAWIVQGTLRDCATGAPRASLTSLVTFHRRGTPSRSTAHPAFALGQRPSRHGLW